MTHAKWAALTPERQRIKVAELCGWAFFELIGCRLEGLPQCDSPGGPWPFSNSDVPDFLNDLNAMHAAVKKMVDTDVTTYDKFRVNLLRCSVRPLLATAAQWAEAFVLTMEPET